MELQGAFNAAYDATTQRLRITFDPDAPGGPGSSTESQDVVGTAVGVGGTALRVVRV